MPQMSRVSALLFALLAGCGEVAAPDLPGPGAATPVGSPDAAAIPSASTAPLPTSVAGPSAPRDVSTYRSIDVQWPLTTPEQAAASAHAAAEILLARTLPLAAFVSSAKAALSTADQWEGFPLNDGVLHVKYFARSNDLRLSNESLNQESEQDFQRAAHFDERQARGIAERAAKRLSAAGLVDDAACSKFKVSRTQFLLGAPGDVKPAEITTQYRFLANQHVAGVAFMNAGFQVAVHYSGQLASVRLGGARLSERKGPANSFQSGFKASEAELRFRREFPKGHAEWHGLRYFLPSDAHGVTTIEPLHVFSFSTVEGGLVSRRRYVGYPVKNPDGAPVELLSTPNETESGDTRSGAPQVSESPVR